MRLERKGHRHLPPQFGAEIWEGIPVGFGMLAQVINLHASLPQCLKDGGNRPQAFVFHRLRFQRYVQCPNVAGWPASGRLSVGKVVDIVQHVGFGVQVKQPGDGMVLQDMEDPTRFEEAIDDVGLPFQIV